MSTAPAAYTGPDYSHLVGKQVRIPTARIQDRIAGRLVSWQPLEGTCHSMFIRRRSGVRTYVGGTVALEEVRRPAPAPVGAPVEESAP